MNKVQFKTSFNSKITLLVKSTTKFKNNTQVTEFPQQTLQDLLWILAHLTFRTLLWHCFRTAAKRNHQRKTPSYPGCFPVKTRVPAKVHVWRFLKHFNKLLALIANTWCPTQVWPMRLRWEAALLSQMKIRVSSSLSWPPIGPQTCLSKRSKRFAGKTANLFVFGNLKWRLDNTAPNNLQGFCEISVKEIFFPVRIKSQRKSFSC